MTTASMSKPKTMPPARPRETGSQKMARVWPMTQVWKHRYAAYQRGEAVRMPEAELMTCDETCWALRIDILTQGDRRKGLASLRRLTDKRLLRPVSFAGAGGGTALYPSGEVAALIERVNGEM